MRDLSGSGIKPVSPALAGGFLSAAPPEKPPTTTLENHWRCHDVSLSCLRLKFAAPYRNIPPYHLHAQFPQVKFKMIVRNDSALKDVFTVKEYIEKKNIW